MRAYVIGNAVIDETIFVDEMPAPGTSILGRTGTRDLGGKGANQAIVMGRCGLPTTLIAPVGDDPRGALIRALLGNEPLDARLVETPGKASDTSLVFRLPSGENFNVTTTEAAQSLQIADVVENLSSAQAGDLAVLQGNLSDSATRDSLAHARSLGMVTAFNPSPSRSCFDDLWSSVDIVFLNTIEAAALTGLTGLDAARRLLEKGARQVVLSLGAEGVILAGQGGETTVPAAACQVVDTTGAGDTLMATTLAFAALRKTVIDHATLGGAVQAAAITVSRMGTRLAFPTTHELRRIVSDIAFVDGV